MTTVVTDPGLEQELRASRETADADRYDEVWDGIYMMTPLPNSEHQRLVNRIAFVLTSAVEVPGLGIVFPGLNVSDRVEGWEHNFRAPDVGVVLPGSRATDYGTHHVGGPDFLVEIVSKFDRSRDKLPFYGQLGVRELLIVDRFPWGLELYRRRGAATQKVQLEDRILAVLRQLKHLGAVTKEAAVGADTVVEELKGVRFKVGHILYTMRHMATPLTARADVKGVKKATFITSAGLKLLEKRPAAELILAGRSTVDEAELLASSILPLSFRLLPGDTRPIIEVTHHDGVQRWTV